MWVLIVPLMLTFSWKPHRLSSPAVSVLPAGAGVCFRMVVLLGARCRRRRRLYLHLLLDPDMSRRLHSQLGHRGLTGGFHAACRRARAAARRRGHPREPRGGAPALWLADGAGAGVPRGSNSRSSRTAPTRRRLSKLSAAAAAQVRPGAAAGHQPAATPRASCRVHAGWAEVAANGGSVRGAATRPPRAEVVSVRRRGVRRSNRGVTEPPPSDPEDLLHVELLPRGRTRATIRHSRAQHEEMAGSIPEPLSRGSGTRVSELANRTTGGSEPNKAEL